MNKIVTAPQLAVADVNDWATIMFGGFGSAGVPANLILALRDKGTKNITAIQIGSGASPEQWLDLWVLFENKQIRKFISSFPIQPARVTHFERAYLAGEVELELVPQGTLVERVRAGGAGIPAFYTPTGADTVVAHGKETRVFQARKYILEHALTADFAFIKAHKADRLGNLTYNKAARNINPLIAMSAKVTIAEVDEIVEVGELDPEAIVTPGIFVHRVVKAKKPETTFGLGKGREMLGQGAAGRDQALGGATQVRKGLSRELIALRIARELWDGDYVNLGIGLPTLVSGFIPGDMDIVLHSQNGILGYGPVVTDPEKIDPELVNAGGQPVTLRNGACFFNHADSFAMIRGGHLDVCVLGAFQVSEKGDLANWMTPGRRTGSIGGAMDLVTNAKRVVVAMEHVTPSGEPRIVKECTYPLTGKGVVNNIVTDLAYIEVTPHGLLLKEVAPGVTPEEVMRLTEPKLVLAEDLKEMEL